MQDGNEEKPRQTTSEALHQNLTKFLRREGGRTPVAPLTNRDSTTPLQDIRDRNLKPNSEVKTR